MPKPGTSSGPSLTATSYSPDIEDMDLPGYRLHQLKGKLAGHRAIDVNRNWRITFSFKGCDADNVNYEDYH